MKVLRDTQSPPAQLDIKLLGRFEVLLAGEPIPEKDWGRRKTKILLKILLTNPGRVFTQDQLIEALFGGENVAKELENLYGRVSQLRRALEPDLKHGVDSRFILRKGQGYCFEVQDSCTIDTLTFAQVIERARSLAEQEDSVAAVEAFETALDQYQGDLLPEDRYEDWAEQRREELRSLYLDGLSRLAVCYAHIERLRQAISCCQKILSLEPYRESVIRQLMEYEHTAGRRSKALETYNVGKQALREHLDVEPAAETQALHERIRKHNSESRTLDPRRIAVIPFVSIGEDSSETFLADGMTEALIYTLSKVAGLEIIAQTTVLKYKGAKKSAAEIGQELRVGSILEGSAQRVGEKARILTQLINVENEAHLWAEQYDLDLRDILSLQGDIARQVADALKVQLLAKEVRFLQKDDRVDLRARTAYTKGKVLLAERSHSAYLKAISCFEQALSIAPAYARALTGLAGAYSMMVGFISAADGYEEARKYVQQALDIDPVCAEAHAALGYIVWRCDGDIRKAEIRFRRAIELDPNHAQAHEWYVGLLIHTGRVQEACFQSENALALDPLSAPLIESYAESLHEAGRLDEAVEQYRHALKINPTLDTAWFGLWYCHAAAWDWDRAEAVVRQTVDDHPDEPYAHVNLSTCVMNRGRLEEGLEAIRKALELEPDPKRTYVLFHAGMRYYYARDFDTAISFFRRALERDPSWNWAHLLIARCLMYMPQPRLDEALEEIAAAEQTYGGADPFWQVYVHMDRGRIYARTGETVKAEKELEVLRNRQVRGNWHIAISGILAELGRMEEAMDWLEKAATAREAHIASLLMCPDADVLRSQSRFQALLKRVGLAS